MPSSNFLAGAATADADVGEQQYRHYQEHYSDRLPPFGRSAAPSGEGHCRTVISPGDFLCLRIAVG
jgi:hypothetical protein